MLENLYIVWFASLVGTALVWLILIVWTFRHLRIRHTATYEAIGSPSLFWNNSPRNNWLFFKFLFQGQWRQLNDPQLAVVARIMQVLFAVYMVGFVGLIVCMFAGLKPA